MKLYIIRHLPTSWNVAGKLQGKANISILPVSKADEERIAVNKETLQEVNFDAVLTSSLDRTKQTAGHYGYQSHQEELLIDEFDFGRYEGVEKKIMIEEIGDLWIDKFGEVKLGEATVDLKARCQQFIQKYKSYDNVLAFSHGVIMRTLLSIYERNEFDHANRRVVHNNELLILDFA